MNLYKLRCVNNMTQQEIANILGISVSTYNTYENGTRNIPCKIANKISEIFDIKVDDIFLPVTFTNRKSE